MKTIGRIHFILVLILVLSSSFVKAQGIDCSSASPFCSDDPTYVFPASVGVPSLGEIGCLYTTPNPAWYWMQIGNSGSMNIHMSSSSLDGTTHDVDFICWGPFTSLSAACASNLMSNAGVDCSYSAAAQEDCYIPSAISGQIYVLLITNYANATTNISFSQTSGSGSSNCAIMTPPPIGDTVCEGETATLVVSNPVAGASYTWEGPNDFYLNTTQPTITIPNATQTNAGTYSLSISLNGRVGDPVYCTVVVNSKPTMSVTTDTICVGEIATLTASGATSYHWSNNQGTSSINISPIVTTPYSVTGTSMWGCKDSVQTQVVVFNNPVITVTPSVICSGDSSTAFAPNALSYSWNNGLDTARIVSPVVTSQQTYVLTVIVPGGCRDSATLIVNPNPIVTCTATEICAGETSIVTASGANTYNWSNFQSGTTISVSPMNNMVLTVNGTDINGCKGSSQTTVIVHPTPVSSFNPSETLITIEDGDITFTDNSTDATTWYYNFGEYNNNLNTSTEQSPTHKYLHTGYFQVWQVVSTDFGCMDSSYIRVQVEAPYFFYIPSAFTPDHDGKNESFCPSGKGIDINNYSMEIYDRWGAMVFHTNVPLGCWDGMINGVRAPVGSYIYKISLKDEEAKHHDYMGDFMILR